MSKLPFTCLSLLALAASPTVFAAASAPEPADPRIAQLLGELEKVTPIRAVALSPDGHRLAWVVKRGAKSTIELAQIDGSQVRPLGAIGAGCAADAPNWSPDSHQLAFIASCDGAAGGQNKQIYLADTEHEQAPHQLGRLEGYPQAIHWNPDGKGLTFLYVAGATRTASALAAAKPAVGEVGVEGIEVQRIARMDVATGTLNLLTPADRYIYEFDLSADGKQLAYTAAPPPGDNNWWVADLYAQAATSDAPARLLVDTQQVQGDLHQLQIALPRWSPNGQQIAFIGGLMSDQGSTGGDIYQVAASGGVPINLTPGIHVTPVWLSWNDDHRLLVSQVLNGTSQVTEYQLAGGRASASRNLFTLPASIGDGRASMALSLSRDHRQVAFLQSSYNAAPEVHAGPLDEHAPPAVSHINDQLKPQWGKAESVEWESEGRHVQGWLLYPADYDPSRRYPLIVNVHGGPAAAVLPRWPGVGFGGVPFSTLGYFVLMPNPRGSFGQGEAYVQANRKDFGHGDLRDILAGIDKIEQRLPVDDQRLGLSGWSYGGFMSMFAPTQTQRFRAVVAGAGIANWQSYYGQNLIDQWMTPYFGASVYDDPAVYAKSSAINFIKQVKTPTLIVVGDRDAECPAPQSFEYWHALRAQHVPTSLVVYPNEGHGFVDPAHQRDVLQRALNWFQRYLPENH